MHLPSLLAACAALSTLTLAVPTISTHAVHEKRGLHTTSWTKRSRVESRSLLPIRIGLKQDNLHRGHDWVMDVADPKSPNYGKHWTEEQVHAAFAPADDSVREVMEWLVSEGIDLERISHSHNRGWLAFEATVEEAEDLFKTEYYEQEHSNGKWAVGCDESVFQNLCNIRVSG